MPKYCGIGGEVREITSQFQGVDGEVRETSEEWCGIDGEVRELYSASRSGYIYRNGAFEEISGMSTGGTDSGSNQCSYWCYFAKTYNSKTTINIGAESSNYENKYNGCAWANSKETIDLRKVKTVKVSFSYVVTNENSTMMSDAQARFSFGFRTEKVSGTSDSGTYKSKKTTGSTTANTDTSLTLDVSSLKGDYYFWIRAHSYRAKTIQVYITQIYFE